MSAIQAPLPFQARLRGGEVSRMRDRFIEQCEHSRMTSR
jgi:hypothetical protein